MAEIEIKLQVPDGQLAGVRAAVLRGRCATARFRAIYFDTADRKLLAAGFVLRLRHEGRRWVQAIKGPGDGLLTRLEHEVVLGPGRTLPALDIERHAAMAEYETLRAALGESGAALLPNFEMRFKRTSRTVRHQGAMIELALDEGEIEAGAERAPISEVELELQRGPVGALADLAGRWSERHGLWIDVRSKSERGHLMAAGEVARPAAKGTPPRLSHQTRPPAALRACVQAALAQVLPNVAALAADAGSAEHVHQARIGLRRLLSVLREFGAWSADVDAQWSVGASRLFKQLGGTRDRDVLDAWVLPQLQAAGAPPFAFDDRRTQSAPSDACRSIEATRCLLALLAFSAGTAEHASGHDTDETAAVLALAGPRLARLHRRVRRAGKDFASIDDSARHRARKQLKRLRYCAESLSSLFPPDAWRVYARKLRKAQDALGRFQDLALAQGAFSTLLELDPQAWFALGWIAARRPAAVADAGRALRALGKTPKFLR
jgi:inorganic triphosphatase YgiF